MNGQALTDPMVLASASPRRQELLSLFGLPFEVVPSRADETAVGDGKEQVQLLACRKAEDVAARMPDRLVLAADTLVCVDHEVLGKPTNQEDAVRMLTLLSGRAHQVHTGICLMAPDGWRHQEVCTTEVQFMSLSRELIQRYVATGEPMDKAGAYAIQGKAGIFVTGIHGSPSNVIGLPLEALTRAFIKLGLQLF